MLISVINFTNGKVTNAELQAVIRAINRQIKEDFKPYWSLDATLRLDGKSDVRASRQNPIDMRGDAVIYLVDKVSNDTAGLHDLDKKGIPYGFVYLDLSKKLSEPWSVTLSHEALELIGDTEVNLLVAGPHPDKKIKYEVFHWYEMCDAVQDESYEIDGIQVSNFILPLYFTGGDEYDGRNDFLGTRQRNGATLTSFGVNPGGYIGFYDPHQKKHITWFADEVAKKRMKIKGVSSQARRAIRYQKHK